MTKLFAVASSALAVLVFAPSAFACPYTGATQVFKPWGDPFSYVLTPDGGLEAGGRGWTLSSGAKVVAGNESHYLRAATDTRSLSLPGGSAATSPPICVALDTPVLRTMIRNTGSSASRLRVEVIYELLGLVRTKVVKDVAASASWSPSPYISPTLGLSTTVGTVLPSTIQVRFRPLDKLGDWRIDDFYVDPYSRR